MLLRVWSGQPYRATRDLDLLRAGANTSDAIHADMELICSTAVDADGIAFDATTRRNDVLFDRRARCVTMR